MSINIQAVMERTGLPAYNSAYRRGDDEQMPEEYLIYSAVMTMADWWDDRYNSKKILVTVHVCSRGNPMESAERVCTEMAGEGLSLVTAQDLYDEDADLYIKVMQFAGKEDV